MKLVWTFCFLSLLCFADTKPQLLAPEAVKKVLKTISHTAIVYGNGPKQIHSFIDPKCEMSRRYMQFVMKKKSMLERYTYYFYLLELPRLDSEGYIGYILDSKMPEKLLLSIMLNDHRPEHAQDYLPGEKSETVMYEIIEAAEQIGVYKRPYIIYNGKAK
ncbi:MAG: hypothetical protein R3302_00515 [Sulfurimonadaceae bacterium]|nr:hypothetical protein [Sulfurimonadaceae bacterium]